jgi:hypothetical protein
LAQVDPVAGKLQFHGEGELMSTIYLRWLDGSAAKRLRSWGAMCVGGLAFMLVAGGLVRPAAAYSILVHYCAEDSPSFDPDGLRLMDIADAAAGIWEDYLIGNDVQDICFSWDADLGGAIGSSDSVSNDIDLLSIVGPDESDGGWYIDPTPYVHSEYDLVTTFYRDLTPGQKTDWFEGDPPPMLEVGYGFTRDAEMKAVDNISPSAPPEAVDRHDLLSTVIHEIGHILGVNYDTADETWDPRPEQVGMADMEIKPDPDSSGHIADRYALMCKGCGKENVRRLPSAVDILAVDADEGPISDVDLPRKEFLQGSWNNGPSWLGGLVPGASDDAFVRNNSILSLWGGVNVAAKNLLIGEGTTFTVGDGKLSVLETTRLTSALGFLQTEFNILADGEAELDDLQIAGGKLDISFGKVTIDATLTIDNGGG